MFIKKLCAAFACALVLAPAASASSGWAPTGAMAVGRSIAQAVLLTDGRVLVAGGSDGSHEVDESEIYDPATGTWSVAAQPLQGRRYATLTRLNDGRVLLAGGNVGSPATAAAEIYDPATNTWTATGSMAQARAGHGATLLPNGKVLVAGGADGPSGQRNSAELYDPATGTWSPAGLMNTPRQNHLQELLPNGRVLVAGGLNNPGTLTYLPTAQLYDPSTNAWTVTGSLSVARTQMASAVLGDGTVLAAGGLNSGGFVTSAERYSPSTGTWSPAGTLPGQSNLHAGVRLPDGRAFVLSVGDITRTAVLFDPARGMSAAGSTSVIRVQPTVTALADGRVLVAGGAAGGVRAATAELYTPPTTRTAADAFFGTVPTGGTAERDVTVTNTGGVALWPRSVTVTGADASAFAIVADGCSGHAVAAGASCVVRVRFTAAGALGAREARLTLDDNADGVPASALRGTVAPAPDPPATPDPPAPPTPDPPTTPVPPAPPTPPTPPAAAPKPAPTPKACSSRRKFTMSKSLTRTIRSGTATLNGKVIAHLSSRKRTITIDLRGRRAGTYTLRVTIKTKQGRTVKLTRKYKTCAPRG